MLASSSVESLRHGAQHCKALISRDGCSGCIVRSQADLCWKERSKHGGHVSTRRGLLRKSLARHRMAEGSLVSTELGLWGLPAEQDKVAGSDTNSPDLVQAQAQASAYVLAFNKSIKIYIN